MEITRKYWGITRMPLLGDPLISHFALSEVIQQLKAHLIENRRQNYIVRLFLLKKTYF